MPTKYNVMFVSPDGAGYEKKPHYINGRRCQSSPWDDDLEFDSKAEAEAYAQEQQELADAIDPGHYHYKVKVCR